jgi:hypothetical protein
VGGSVVRSVKIMGVRTTIQTIIRVLISCRIMVLVQINFQEMELNLTI